MTSFHKMSRGVLNLLAVVFAIAATTTSFYSSGASSMPTTTTTWCVCKEGLSDSVLQKTLDYACGAGADCSPVRPNGPCYSPTSVRAHCSYAVNSYYHKNTAATDACDFAGTASLTTSNPSTNGCSFPTSASGSGTTGTTTPSTTVPSTTPTTTTPTKAPVSTTTPISGGSPMVSGTPTTASPYTTTVQPTTGTTTTTATTPTTTSYPNGLTTGIAPTGSGMSDNRGGTVGPTFGSVVAALLMLLLLCN